VERFPWERIAPKFDWIRLIEALPVTSPLLTGHELCGRRLRASTIKHVGVTIAHAADEDGTNARRGIERLTHATSRARATAIIAVGHLETVGLLTARLRAGTAGIPRTFATNYCLTLPPLDVIAQAQLGEEESRVYDWFAKRAAGEAG
jgi:hypothetical protein